MPSPRALLAAVLLAACATAAPAAHAAEPTVQLFGGGAVEANSITADPDGNAYVLAAEGAAIGKVSPTGVKSSIDFPDSTGPGIRLRGITSGPDDALWFSYNGMLSRVPGTGGDRTEYPIAVGGRAVVGPDGNLWFPEADTANIARVSPAGVISRFGGASAGAGPLTVGPDGSLWYANAATAGVIGRVTEAGIVTERPVPDGVALSGPIASDGDDGLWALLAGGGFAHLDLEGHLLGAFATGLTSAPTSIALGADGNLWFVELGTAGIGWITPSGQIHELLSPFGFADRPSDIAAAGDGTLWATDFTNAIVWRISPARPTAFTGAASAVTPAGATLAGLVTPRGTRTTTTFEYGTTDAYGDATAPQDAGAGDDDVPVTAVLTGLRPSTTYHYRLVARSGVGTVLGQDGTFTTPAAPVDPPTLAGPVAGTGDATPPKGATTPPTPVTPQGKVVVPPSTLPRVALTHDARWERRGKAIVFTRLTIGALPAGARLTLTCRGAGCGFARYATTLRAATKTTNLLVRLRGSRLRNGAVLELRVTLAGHVGRVVRWTIGAKPKPKALCLPPGAAAPAAC